MILAAHEPSPQRVWPVGHGVMLGQLAHALVELVLRATQLPDGQSTWPERPACRRHAARNKH